MPDRIQDLEEARLTDSRAVTRRRKPRQCPTTLGMLALIGLVGVGLYVLAGALLDRDLGPQHANALAPVIRSPVVVNLSRASTTTPVTLSSPHSLSSSANTSTHKRFAYMFYVTKDIYACAALHLMRHLVFTVGMDTARIDLVVLHSPRINQVMLQRIQEQFPVRFIQVDPLLADAAEPTWHESLTKLLIFREWGYDRVVYMDADSVPMQNLDHLFELPSAPLNAPFAYWLPQPFFSSILMVLEPSNARFDAMMEWARAQGAAAGFDMDIVNSFFKDTVQYLPGDYTVLNSDFRAGPETPNKLYASTTELKQHAQLVHFSCKPDGSYGKPWTAASRDVSFAAAQGLDPLFAAMYKDFWATQDHLCASTR